ncbi:hypothetical protein LKV13_01860 [Borrelia sp. BU AG58]|uniref:hypothetical protein n=1 Tax=Borrelia sp. BU AG58 TaxID=2887345 RepID=UPI001E5EA52C|nr:hypothetical protein [Borrelia sp. BU AG58]UER67551.1 hypothetical protein LKV13_01860 [Borrelia sp. BU AG58]
MVDRVLLIFNVMFVGFFVCLIFFLEILKYLSLLDFILFHFHVILGFILLMFIFNIFYSKFLYSRLYFVFNGVDSTYAFLKLKILRKRLKSVFDISLCLKMILIRQDKKSLDEIYLYLKDSKISNKTIVELYSVLISFREKEKASSLILKYASSRNRWVEYCVALSMISFKEYEKLSETLDLLKKFFLKEPIFTIYYYYALKRSNAGPNLIETVKLDIRDKYFKYRDKLNAKHAKLLGSNLFFVVFYYIYDSAKKDIFY